MIGSDMSCLLRELNAALASSGSGPPLYPESFRVSLKSGAATMAKFLMWVLKKLQRPTKDRIVLTSSGTLAV